jgi:hypothetical protein
MPTGHHGNRPLVTGDPFLGTLHLDPTITTTTTPQNRMF